MAHPKYVLKSATDDRYYFNLTARNGQVILTSQMYTSKSNATKGIESVQVNSSLEDRFALYKSSDGQFYFNLKANNNQIIGTSEMYSSAEMRDKGVDSAKVNGATVETEDLTSDEADRKLKEVKCGENT